MPGAQESWSTLIPPVFASCGRFAYVADRKPSSAVKWVAGAIMYVLVLAFLVAMVGLVRRADPAHAAARPD